MAGSQTTALSCASAVNVEGDLKLTADTGPSGLVGNVWGNLTISAVSNGLSNLRCLQTVGGSVLIELASGELDALSRLRSVGGDLTIQRNAHDQ